MGRTMIPTEAQEQEALFYWASIEQRRYPELALLHAIPNGGSRHPVEAKHLKAQGVKAGIPDIFLPVARQGYHGLYIELKRVKGGCVSEAQQRWLDYLREQGYKAEVCRGFEEARREIVVYLADF